MQCSDRPIWHLLYFCCPTCFGALCWFSWPNLYALAQDTLIILNSVHVDCLSAASITQYQLLFPVRNLDCSLVLANADKKNPQHREQSFTSSYITLFPTYCLPAQHDWNSMKFIGVVYEPIKHGAAATGPWTVQSWRILKNKCTQMHLYVNAHHVCFHIPRNVWECECHIMCSNIPVITSMCFLAPNTPGCKGRNWQSISLQLSSAWAGNASQVLLQLFLQHANTVVLAFGNILVVWRNIWELHWVKHRKAAGRTGINDMDQHGITLAGQHKHLNVQVWSTDEAASLHRMRLPVRSIAKGSNGHMNLWKAW